MIKIKCNRCGATSSGNTIVEARAVMNHAVGLSRGIKCGDNYNYIETISDESNVEPSKQITNTLKQKLKYKK